MNEDEHPRTDPSEETAVVESPSLETQLLELNGDTEVLDIPHFADNLRAHMVDDSENEVVLDSDDEEIQRNGILTVMKGLSCDGPDRTMGHNSGQYLSDVVGSPYYVAPEVLHKYYGHESDVWSAGVILYILLCGVPPFWAETDSGIFRQILKGKIDFESEPWPQITDSAKDLIKKMLNRSPRDRITAYQVLCHPWIVDDRVAPDKPLDSAVLSRLKQFSAMNKLKKMALRIKPEGESRSPCLSSISKRKVRSAQSSWHSSDKTCVHNTIAGNFGEESFESVVITGQMACVNSAQVMASGKSSKLGNPISSALGKENKESELSNVNVQLSTTMPTSGKDYKQQYKRNSSRSPLLKELTGQVAHVNSVKLKASERSSKLDKMDPILSAAGKENKGNELSNVNVRATSGKDYKPQYMRNSLRPPLLKEITRLGFAKSLPNFVSKDLRRRRNKSNIRLI